MIVHIFFFLYTKLIVVSIAYLYIPKILFWYVDTITRQTYDYATPVTCDPGKIIELDPYTDNQDNQDFYII